MLLLPNLLVIRRVVVALVLSVFVGVAAIAQTTPAWAANDLTQRGSTIAGVGQTGQSVAMSTDGLRMIVASPSAGANYEGNVSVYDWVSGDWVKDATDWDGGAPYEQLGEEVVISGDGSRIAFTSEDWMMMYATVHWYQKSGSSWTSLRNFGPVSLDQGLGHELSMSRDGTRIAFANSGSTVQVWEEAGGSFTQIGAGDITGTHLKSVALSADGSRLVVGSPRKNSNVGEVGVWEESGGSWAQIGSTFTGSATNEYFGEDVAMSDDGSRIAIGITLKNSPRGAVQVWDNTAGSTWALVGTEFNGDVSQSYYGRSVSLSGDGSRLGIGVWNSAEAEVWEESSGSWTQIGNIDTGISEVSQIAISGNGSYVGIGDRANSGYTGQVLVFSLPVAASGSSDGNSSSGSASAGVPGIFLTVAGPVGRSASEAPVYYGADRVAVTSTYLLTVTRVSNVTPTITTLAEGTIDADGSFSSMTRLPALAPGVYNVQMVGTHVNGSTLQLTSQVTIGGVGQFTSIGANIPVIK
jgi:hypothetical protein